MKIARVIAPVVATQKHPSYCGLRTFLVKPLKLDGSPEGTTFVAIDRVQAGVGDLVLLLQEGSSARFILNNREAPARSVIVGVIDHVEIDT